MDLDGVRALMERPTWMADANCRGLDPELFFPAKGEETSQIKAVCRACDVQAECLAYAMNGGEEHGIWGGLSGRERRRLRRGAPVSGRKPITHGTKGGYNAHRRRGEDPCEACRDANTLYMQGYRSA